MIFTVIIVIIVIINVAHMCIIPPRPHLVSSHLCRSVTSRLTMRDCEGGFAGDGSSATADARLPLDTWLSTIPSSALSTPTTSSKPKALLLSTVMGTQWKNTPPQPPANSSCLHFAQQPLPGTWFCFAHVFHTTSCHRIGTTSFTRQGQVQWCGR